MLNNRLDESTSNNLFYLECSIGKSKKDIFLHLSFASFDTANKLFKQMKDKCHLPVAIYGNRIVVFPGSYHAGGVYCGDRGDVGIAFLSPEYAHKFFEFAKLSMSQYDNFERSDFLGHRAVQVSNIDSLKLNYSFEKRIVQTENVNHAVFSLFFLSQVTMTTPLNKDIIGLIKSMFVLLDMSPDLQKQIALSRQFLFYTQSPPFSKENKCIGNPSLEIKTVESVCCPDIDISYKYKNTMGFPKPHVTFDTFGFIIRDRWQYDEAKKIIIQSCSSKYAAMYFYQENNIKPLVTIFTDGFASGGLTLNGILAASNAPYAMPKDLGEGLVQDFGGIYLISNAEIKVDDKITPVNFAFIALPNLDQSCEADYFDGHSYLRHVTTLMIMQFQLAKIHNTVLIIDREGFDAFDNTDEDIAAIIHAVNNMPEFRSVQVIIALGGGIKDIYENPLKDRVNEVEECITFIRCATQLDLNSLSRDLKKRYIRGMEIANSELMKDINLIIKYLKENILTRSSNPNLFFSEEEVGKRKLINEMKIDCFEYLKEQVKERFDKQLKDVIWDGLHTLACNVLKPFYQKHLREVGHGDLMLYGIICSYLEGEMKVETKIREFMKKCSRQTAPKIVKAGFNNNRS